MKILICGGRDFTNYEYLKSVVDDKIERVKILYPSDKTPIEIVSGGAHGADSLAEKYALEKGYSFKVFHANWDKFGRGAGHIRNEEMAYYTYKAGEPHRVIAFWDGKSRGTANMIQEAKTLNLDWCIYYY